jgi:hypothetical protein
VKDSEVLKWQQSVQQVSQHGRHVKLLQISGHLIENGAYFLALAFHWKAALTVCKEYSAEFLLRLASVATLVCHAMISENNHHGVAIKLVYHTLKNLLFIRKLPLNFRMARVQIIVPCMVDTNDVCDHHCPIFGIEFTIKVIHSNLIRLIKFGDVEELVWVGSVDIFSIEADPSKASSKNDILMFCSGLLSGFSRSQLLENGIFRHFLAAKVVLNFNKRIKSTC